jgi:uncharacterized protein (TIGR03435 family)
VASIKVVPMTSHGIEEETPRRVLYRAELPLLVMRAYEIKTYQLANRQLLEDSRLPRYEIQATLPPGSVKGDIPAMLRSLLEDRFQLSTHWEERPMQIYNLELDPSGLKLERPKTEAPAPDRPLQILALRQGLVKFSGEATLQQLADFLTPAMDHPVLNKTAAVGIFQISLDARVPAPDVDLSGLPLFAGKSVAVNGPDQAGTPADISVHGATVHGNASDLGVALKKLGLRIDKGKENMKVLVIDSVNKTFKEN